MSEICKHEELVLGMKKDLYNDGMGIRYKVSELWDFHNKQIGKRDVLLAANSIILLINGTLLIFTHLGVL
jgi:hypothetical protein